MDELKHARNRSLFFVCSSVFVRLLWGGGASHASSSSTAGFCFSQLHAFIVRTGAQQMGRILDVNNISVNKMEPAIRSILRVLRSSTYRLLSCCYYLYGLGKHVCSVSTVDIDVDIACFVYTMPSGSLFTSPPPP